MMFDDTTNTDGVTPEGVEEGGKCGGEGQKCGGEGEKKEGENCGGDTAGTPAA